MVSVPLASLGIPVTVHIPVRSSIWAPLSRLLRKLPPEHLLRLPWGSARVYVPEDDEGELSVVMSVVNFSDRDIQVEYLILGDVTVNGNELKVDQPKFEPPQHPVRGFGMSDVFFRVNLGAPAIRTLLRMVDARAPYVSPRVELIVRGVLGLSIPGRFWAFQWRPWWPKRVQFRFEVPVRTPELNINPPRARQ